MREQTRSSEKLGAGKFVRFSAPVLSRIESIARAERRKVSAVVRLLTEEALAARERQSTRKSA